MLAAKAGRRARPYRALLSQRDLIQDAWLHLLTKEKEGKLVLDWKQEATRARLITSADRHMIDRARHELGPDRNPKAGIKSIAELAEY